MWTGEIIGPLRFNAAIRDLQHQLSRVPRIVADTKAQLFPQEGDIERLVDEALSLSSIDTELRQFAHLKNMQSS